MSTTAERPVSQPTTARGQLTRQKLLDAAEAIFGEKGFDRASINDITQRAGVAQGTFYVYFPDKKAIFVELVRELSHRLRRDISESISGIHDRATIEEYGFRAFLLFVHRHRNLYRIVRQAEFVDEELYRWYYHRFAEGYVEGLEAAMQAGRIGKTNAEALAYCLMGICDFLGMRWVLWEGATPPDDVFNAVMTFIRRGMDAPPGTPATPQPGPSGEAT